MKHRIEKQPLDADNFSHKLNKRIHMKIDQNLYRVAPEYEK